MTASAPHLQALTDAPATDPAETERCARRLVSDRFGIIRRVTFRELGPDLPPVYCAVSTPCDTRGLFGIDADCTGSGASVDPERAIAKAVGETVERYCAASHDLAALPVCAGDQLAGEHAPLVDLAPFSERQYAEPGFRYARLDPTSPVRWVCGTDLATGRALHLPAGFVYFPYPRAADEARYIGSITTGLAAAPGRAEALYRAALECIERDAFMIVWHNRLERPTIDLARVEDPLARRLAGALGQLPLQCRAVLLTVDIPVPVVLILLTGAGDRPPHTAVAMAADLDPTRALVRALEEALSVVVRLDETVPRYVGDPGAVAVRELDPLERRFVLHAIDPSLRHTVEFLTAARDEVALADIPNRSSVRRSAVENLETLCGLLAARSLSPIACDLTSDDVARAGFCVTRVVIPGLVPLDVHDDARHLGPSRLYTAPVEIGARPSRLPERELNPHLHPFP